MEYVYLERGAANRMFTGAKTVTNGRLLPGGLVPQTAPEQVQGPEAFCQLGQRIASQNGERTSTETHLRHVHTWVGACKRS
jgi:hypothetical protein